MKLIDNAKHWWKFWSIRLNALGALLMFYSLPIADWWHTNAAEYLPNANPHTVQYIGLGLLVVGQVARVIKQENINGKKDNSTTDS